MTGQANRNLRQSAAPEVKRQAIDPPIHRQARINHLIQCANPTKGANFPGSGRGVNNYLTGGVEGEGFQVYGVGHGLGAFVVEVHAVAAVQGGVASSGK